jgi:glyoxylase-like metal-dependent hydrolase (beta-lactamase superfamily II)
MRVVDTKHLGNERVIGCWEHGGVLVDPGPESTVETLLAGLGEGFHPEAVLLTHIHFDHAGGTGALVERWPDLPVYVHEKGAPHVIDPERLVRSATRLYGEEDMKRLWGDVVPVPERNVHALRGGEQVRGDYRCEYTPGHASHHVCYFHEPTATALVGDMAGVRIPPSDLVVAPTPPPDIDIAAWKASVDVIQGWQPERLALTHFGEVTDDIEGHLDRLRASLDEQVERTARLTLEEFVASQTAVYEERVDLDTARTYAQAVPHHHIWLGLDRWRAKAEEAAGS